MFMVLELVLFREVGKWILWVEKEVMVIFLGVILGVCRLYFIFGFLSVWF